MKSIAYVSALLFVLTVLLGCGGGGGGSKATSTKGALAAGDSVANNRYYDGYLLRATESGPMSIGLESTAFDPYLGLGDEFGNLIDEDDDSGTGLNALITYNTGYDEEYIVVVTSALSAQTGSYRFAWSDNLIKVEQISAPTREEAIEMLRNLKSKDRTANP